ncbi:MAG: glutamate-5-semialdehyde dehydrogenase [Alphaproteobacteria bacterium]|nr:glutamate-5-semialdehyde dehydrogenase [Alphaproteobacteria bacterium]
MEYVMEKIGKDAKYAVSSLANACTEQKNSALKAAAKSIRDSVELIAEANQKDVAEAEAKNISGAMLERLKLPKEAIENIAKSIEIIADLPDPVGTTISKKEMPSGISIEQVRVPLGIIGIIYESRPNVTADAGALCLKSGNAAILRGGSESFNSSRAIMNCLQKGLEIAGLPINCIQMVPTTDRAAVGEMLKMTNYIDVIIPRGGRSLIERVVSESKIPLFQHLDGICHVYVHKDADIDMACNIVVNAKMRRTGVCNAAETLIIDEDILKTHLPKIVDALMEAGCEVRGDFEACEADERLILAHDEDWHTEYLDSIISVKTVFNEYEAMAFIATHGSNHTDSIITENTEVAETFLREVDSAVVMYNSSTGFSDGGEFGMGAEIGISTGKMHARGPIGLEQLTSFKYKVRSKGAIRE